MTKKPLTRLICVFLSAVLFLTNTVFAHAPERNFWAERERARQSAQVASLPAVQPILPYKSAVLPTLPSFARQISARWLPLISRIPTDAVSIRAISGPKNADTLVFHISDVHRNFEAQQNISRAVGALSATGSVNFVALEGDSKPVDVNSFRTFQDQAAVHMAADWLLRENKISGPVFSALTAPSTSSKILGIDDQELHAANVNAYLASRSVEARARQFNERETEQLSIQLQRQMRPALKDLFNAFSDYSKGKLGLGLYIQRLGKIVPTESRAVHLFEEAYGLERSLDFNRVETERGFLISELTRKLGTESSQRLLDVTLAYRSGFIDHADFYARLKNLCEQNGVSLARYPAMRDYLQYSALSGAVQPEKLLADVSAWEDRAFEKLTTSDAEKELLRSARKNLLEKKLIEFSLTKEEWKKYQQLTASGRGNVEMTGQNISSSRQALGRDLPNRNIETTRGFPTETFGDDESSKVLRPFLSFYSLADQRDTAMSSNVTTALQKTSAGVAVVVTGGFHSDGIVRALNQKGILTVTLVPRLSKAEDKNGSAYLSAFAQEKTPLDKLFAGEKLFLAAPPFDLKATADLTTLAHEIFTPGSLGKTAQKIEKTLDPTFDGPVSSHDNGPNAATLEKSAGKIHGQMESGKFVTVEPTGVKVQVASILNFLRSIKKVFFLIPFAAVVLHLHTGKRDSNDGMIGLAGSMSLIRRTVNKLRKSSGKAFPEVIVPKFKASDAPKMNLRILQRVDLLNLPGKEKDLRLLRAALESQGQDPYTIKFSPDGTKLALGTRDYGGSDPAIIMLGLEPLRILWVARVNAQPASPYAVVPRSSSLMAPSELAEAVSDIDFSADGKMIVTSHYDSPIRFWNAETGELVFKSFRSVDANLAKFGPGGKLFVLGSEKSRLSVIQSDSMKEIDSQDGFGYSLAVKAPQGPAGPLMVAGGSQAYGVHVLDGRTLALLRQISIRHTVMSVDFDSSGRYLAFCDSDGNERVWDLVADRIILDVKSPLLHGIESLRVLPNGRTFILSDREGHVQVRDFSGAVLATKKTAPESAGSGSFDASDDGQFAAYYYHTYEPRTHQLVLLGIKGDEQVKSEVLPVKQISHKPAPALLALSETPAELPPLEEIKSLGQDVIVPRQTLVELGKVLLRAPPTDVRTQEQRIWYLEKNLFSNLSSTHQTFVQSLASLWFVLTEDKTGQAKKAFVEKILNNPENARGLIVRISQTPLGGAQSAWYKDITQIQSVANSNADVSMENEASLPHPFITQQALLRELQRARSNRDIAVVIHRMRELLTHSQGLEKQIRAGSDKNLVAALDRWKTQELPRVTRSLNVISNFVTIGKGSVRLANYYETPQTVFDNTFINGATRLKDLSTKTISQDTLDTLSGWLIAERWLHEAAHQTPPTWTPRDKVQEELRVMNQVEQLFSDASESAFGKLADGRSLIRTVLKEFKDWNPTAHALCTAPSRYEILRRETDDHGHDARVSFLQRVYGKIEGKFRLAMSSLKSSAMNDHQTPNVLAEKINQWAKAGNAPTSVLVVELNSGSDTTTMVREELRRLGIPSSEKTWTPEEGLELGTRSGDEFEKLLSSSHQRHDLIYLSFPNDGRSHSGSKQVRMENGQEVEVYDGFDITYFFRTSAIQLFHSVPVGGHVVLDHYRQWHHSMKYQDYSDPLIYGFEVEEHPYGDGSSLLILTKPAVPVWKSKNLSMAPSPGYGPNEYFEQIQKIAETSTIPEIKSRYEDGERQMNLLPRMGPLLPLAEHEAGMIASRATGLGSQRSESIKSNGDAARAHLMQVAALRHANICDYAAILKQLGAAKLIQPSEVSTILDLGSGSVFYQPALEKVFPGLVSVDGIELAEHEHFVRSEFWEPLLALDSNRVQLHKANAFKFQEVGQLKNKKFDLVLMLKWVSPHARKEDYLRLLSETAAQMSLSGHAVIMLKTEDVDREYSAARPLFDLLVSNGITPVKNWIMAKDYGRRVSLDEVQIFVLDRSQLHALKGDGIVKKTFELTRAVGSAVGNLIDDIRNGGSSAPMADRPVQLPPLEEIKSVGRDFVCSRRSLEDLAKILLLAPPKDVQTQRDRIKYLQLNDINLRSESPAARAFVESLASLWFVISKDRTGKATDAFVRQVLNNPANSNGFIFRVTDTDLKGAQSAWYFRQPVAHESFDTNQISADVVDEPFQEFVPTRKNPTTAPASPEPHFWNRPLARRPFLQIIGSIPIASSALAKISSLRALAIDLVPDFLQYFSISTYFISFKWFLDAAPDLELHRHPGQHVETMEDILDRIGKERREYTIGWRRIKRGDENFVVTMFKRQADSWKRYDLNEPLSKQFQEIVRLPIKSQMRIAEVIYEHRLQQIDTWQRNELPRIQRGIELLEEMKRKDSTASLDVSSMYDSSQHVFANSFVKGAHRLSELPTMSVGQDVVETLSGWQIASRWLHEATHRKPASWERLDLLEEEFRVLTDTDQPMSDASESAFGKLSDGRSVIRTVLKEFKTWDPAAHAASTAGNRFEILRREVESHGDDARWAFLRKVYSGANTAHGLAAAWPWLAPQKRDASVSSFYVLWVAPVIESGFYLLVAFCYGELCHLAFQWELSLPLFFFGAMSILSGYLDWAFARLHGDQVIKKGVDGKLIKATMSDEDWNSLLEGSGKFNRTVAVGGIAFMLVVMILNAHLEAWRLHTLDPNTPLDTIVSSIQRNEIAFALFGFVSLWFVMSTAHHSWTKKSLSENGPAAAWPNWKTLRGKFSLRPVLIGAYAVAIVVLKPYAPFVQSSSPLTSFFLAATTLALGVFTIHMLAPPAERESSTHMLKSGLFPEFLLLFLPVATVAANLLTFTNLSSSSYFNPLNRVLSFNPWPGSNLWVLLACVAVVFWVWMYFANVARRHAINGGWVLLLSGSVAQLVELKVFGGVIDPLRGLFGVFNFADLVMAVGFSLIVYTWATGQPLFKKSKLNFKEKMNAMGLVTAAMALTTFLEQLDLQVIPRAREIIAVNTRRTMFALSRDELRRRLHYDVHALADAQISYSSIEPDLIWSLENTDLSIPPFAELKLLHNTPEWNKWWSSIALRMDQMNKCKAPIANGDIDGLWGILQDAKQSKPLSEAVHQALLDRWKRTGWLHAASERDLRRASTATLEEINTELDDNPHYQWLYELARQELNARRGIPAHLSEDLTTAPEVNRTLPDFTELYERAAFRLEFSLPADLIDKSSEIVITLKNEHWTFEQLRFVRRFDDRRRWDNESPADRSAFLSQSKGRFFVHFNNRLLYEPYHPTLGVKVLLTSPETTRQSFFTNVVLENEGQRVHERSADLPTIESAHAKAALELQRLKAAHRNRIGSSFQDLVESFPDLALTLFPSVDAHLKQMPSQNDRHGAEIVTTAPDKFFVRWPDDTTVEFSSPDELKVNTSGPRLVLPLWEWLFSRPALLKLAALTLEPYFSTNFAEMSTESEAVRRAWARHQIEKYWVYKILIPVLELWMIPGIGIGLIALLVENFGNTREILVIASVAAGFIVALMHGRPGLHTRMSKVRLEDEYRARDIGLNAEPYEVGQRADAFLIRWIAATVFTGIMPVFMGGDYYNAFLDHTTIVVLIQLFLAFVCHTFWNCAMGDIFPEYRLSLTTNPSRDSNSRDFIFNALGRIGQDSSVRQDLLRWPELYWNGRDYNGPADVPLWYVEAVSEYVQVTGDKYFLDDETSPGQSVLGVLASILSRYRMAHHDLEITKMSHDSLTMDLATGFIYVPGARLTWMDSDHTPREGYPIEIQALWYNALNRGMQWAEVNRTSSLSPFTQKDIDEMRIIAAHVRQSFSGYYWNEAEKCFRDVIGGHHAWLGFSSPRQLVFLGKSDPSIRPNQLLAILFGLANERQARLALETVGRKLHIPGALKTLAEPRSRLFDQALRTWAHHFADEEHAKKATGDHSAAHFNGMGAVMFLPIYYVSAARAGVLRPIEALNRLERQLAPIEHFNKQTTGQPALAKFLSGIPYPLSAGPTHVIRGENPHAPTTAMAEWARFFLVRMVGSDPRRKNELEDAVADDLLSLVFDDAAPGRQPSWETVEKYNTAKPALAPNSVAWRIAVLIELLIYDAPGSHGAIRLQRLLERINQHSLPELRRLGNPWAFALPIAEDWVALQSMTFLDERIYSKVIVAIPPHLSPRAAALRFAMNGAHLRHDYKRDDNIDITALLPLMERFLPEMRRLFEDRSFDLETENLRQAYSRALISGLCFPSQQTLAGGRIHLDTMVGLFNAVGKRVPDAREILREALRWVERDVRTVRTNDQSSVPTYLTSVFYSISIETVHAVAGYNLNHPERPISVWQVMTGQPEAQEFIKSHNLAENAWRNWSPEIESADHFRAFLVEQANVALNDLHKIAEPAAKPFSRVGRIWAMVGFLVALSCLSFVPHGPAILVSAAVSATLLMNTDSLGRRRSGERPRSNLGLIKMRKDFTFDATTGRSVFSNFSNALQHLALTKKSMTHWSKVQPTFGEFVLAHFGGRASIEADHLGIAGARFNPQLEHLFGLKIHVNEIPKELIEQHARLKKVDFVAVTMGRGFSTWEMMLEAQSLVHPSGLIYIDASYSEIIRICLPTLLAWGYTVAWVPSFKDVPHFTSHGHTHPEYGVIVATKVTSPAFKSLQERGIALAALNGLWGRVEALVNAGSASGYWFDFESLAVMMDAPAHEVRELVTNTPEGKAAFEIHNDKHVAKRKSNMALKLPMTVGFLLASAAALWMMHHSLSSAMIAAVFLFVAQLMTLNIYPVLAVPLLRGKIDDVVKAKRQLLTMRARLMNHSSVGDAINAALSGAPLSLDLESVVDGKRRLTGATAWLHLFRETPFRLGLAMGVRKQGGTLALSTARRLVDELTIADIATISPLDGFALVATGSAKKDVVVLVRENTNLAELNKFLMNINGQAQSFVLVGENEKAEYLLRLAARNWKINVAVRLGRCDENTTAHNEITTSSIESFLRKYLSKPDNALLVLPKSLRVVADSVAWDARLSSIPCLIVDEIISAAIAIPLQDLRNMDRIAQILAQQA